MISLYVDRTISGRNVTHGYQENIYQSPDSDPSEAEQFTEAALPVTEVEPIYTEPT